MNGLDLSFGDILLYIPQRPPFVLVGGIVSVAEKSIQTIFTIPDGCVMCENGFLLEGGMIENIAQSAAALTGYHTVINKTQVKKGFIGAVKKLKIYTKPLVGSTLNTYVEITDEVFDFTLIKGRICEGENLMAECEMTIFIQQ